MPRAETAEKKLLVKRVQPVAAEKKMVSKRVPVVDQDLLAPKKPLVDCEAVNESKPEKGLAVRKKLSRSRKIHGPTGLELARLVASAAAEHKVISPVLLNLTGLSSVADWFFIASAENSRQVRSVAEKIVRRAREAGVRALGQEGLGKNEIHWALVDLGDVVVHIFNPETRALYDLEGLWADAPRENG